MDFTDTLTFDAPRRTSDGYMVADVKAARTGIQIYNGREVDPDNSHGLRDKAQVRVYRDEAEVFSADSLRSYAYRPITVEHPSEMVTADNWKNYSVGMTGAEVVRDGDFVRVSMAIMDAAAIKAVEGGKRQISQGYTCDVDFTPGVTKDGLEYDATQRSIRANHSAIVGLARGGSQLAIGDGKTMKTILIDGHSVEVSDAAEIAIANLTKRLTDADTATAKLTTDLATANTSVATLTTQIATKDAELVTLTKKLADAAVTPAMLRDAAKSFAATVSMAKQVAPQFTITDAMGENDIKVGVVNTVIGDAAKGWNEVQIAASFTALTAGKTPTADGVDTFAVGFRDTAHVAVGDQKVVDARTAMIAALTNPAAAKTTH